MTRQCHFHAALLFSEAMANANAIFTGSVLSTLPVATRNCRNVRLNRFYCSGKFPPSVRGSGANSLSMAALSIV